MALPLKRPGSSWTAVLLLTGLSVLSWISTYTGIMELITAASGELSVPAALAVAFAVLMLQLMTLYLLDALFSVDLRWWLRPFYAAGYGVLFLIAVGFAFGYYWKYLEAATATASAAERSLRDVQSTLQLGSSRLEQLQSTLAALEHVSAEKAEKERTVGGTCSVGGAGDGRRRRLREADAQRFQFASSFIAQRVADVQTDISAVNGELQRFKGKGSGAGRPNTYIDEVNRKLELSATRFNALRSDPQLLQLNSELKARASQTAFPDDRGGTFTCPDQQLQSALHGVVRAIDELPELRQPELRSYEGSQAVIEAFRRLTNSALATEGGLTQRDLIPLLIAIFVDLCILLVSINRPFGRVFHALSSMEKARQSNLIELLLPVYRVFVGNSDAEFRPKPDDLIAPLVDIVFDHNGKYYAAVPLDFRDEHYAAAIAAQREAAKATGRTFYYDPHSEKPLERCRYISSALVILQGLRFVTLLGRRGRTFSDSMIRKRFDKQGSIYARANSFRVFVFVPGAWAEFLHAVVGSGAEAGRQAERTRTAPSPRRDVTPLERQPASAIPEIVMTVDKSGEYRPREITAQPRPLALADQSKSHIYDADGIDYDPSEDEYSPVTFKR